VCLTFDPNTCHLTKISYKYTNNNNNNNTHQKFEGCHSQPERKAGWEGQDASQTTLACAIVTSSKHRPGGQETTAVGNSLSEKCYGTLDKHELKK